MALIPEKNLGFGLMRMPRRDPANAADIDLEQVKQMVDLFMARGFNYFDTAWMYNGFASEGVARAALVERYDRERFTLADKLHSGFFDSLAERDKIFYQQLEKTGAGYFDYYLLHGVESGKLPKYEKLDAFNWLIEKKSQGLVRHVGFSYHDNAELLDRILTQHPEMEFVQLQINYLDWDSPWVQSRACYETALKHRVPIVVMEPVKGGTLAKLPAAAEKLFRSYDASRSVPCWALGFAASLPGVMMVLSGMGSLQQVEDNTDYMDHFQPLSQEEQQLCFQAARIVNSQIAIPCTSCHYCTEGCPMKIAIPEYFSMYNEDMRERLEEKGWTVNFINYQLLAEKFGKAGQCLKCGCCQEVCPQHLPIIDLLQEVAKHYEKG